MNINEILKAKIIKNPWSHAVVENLFDEEEFLKLSRFVEFYTKKEKDSIKKQWKKTKKSTLYHEQWTKMGFDSNLGEGWLKIFNKIIKDILSHYEQHRFADKYYVQLLFNFMPTNEEPFKIHHDSSKKVWTLAHYLYPQKNTGTKLYDSNHKHILDSPWKPNSGCAFCPRDKVTWHSFENKSLTDFRSVLIINICR